MSGVWEFKNGVIRLVDNTMPGTIRRKVLIHVAGNEVITSYSSLETKLLDLGWERYHEDPALLQFHKRNCIDLISLPRDFRNFSTVNMYDIVVKTRDVFRVVDI